MLHQVHHIFRALKQTRSQSRGCEGACYLRVCVSWPKQGGGRPRTCATALCVHLQRTRAT